MLTFKRKPGVNYYPNSTFRVRAGAQKSRNCTLRTMSDRARKRKDAYREKGFSHWGYQCFLCGRVDPTGNTLDIHHPHGRRNGDDITNLIPLCNRFCGCRAHNHNGTGDPRTAELNAKIQAKMDILNGKRTNQ